MAPAPDGRMFFGEQFSGQIKIIGVDGKLQADPFAQVETTSYLGQDWGLTGLAIDPAFKDDHFVYAFYTQPTAPRRRKPRRRLGRWRGPRSSAFLMKTDAA